MVDDSIVKALAIVAVVIVLLGALGFLVFQNQHKGPPRRIIPTIVTDDGLNA